MIPINEAFTVEKTVSSREIFKGTILRVRVDDAELPNGLIRHREVVEHPGGAVVLAILSDGKILLVRQYRYALGDFLYELPAGKLDPGESPLVTVQRELEEETGYTAQHWEELTYIYTSPGFCNEKITLFKATGLQLSQNARREEDEFIEVIQVTPDELRSMIRERKVVDAKTLCAFGLVYAG